MSGQGMGPTGHPWDGCATCGTPLQSMGVEQFRVGGTSGGWNMLLGKWSEVGESMLPLELLACPSCRRVEFRLPQG